MSEITTDRPVPSVEPESRPSRGLVRAFGGAALLTTPLLFLGAGLCTPPQRSQSDTDYVASLAADPGRSALSAHLYHYAWLAVLFGAVAAIGLVPRGRGRALTAIGALVTVFGCVQVSGLVLADFFNASGGRLVGTDAAASVFTAVSDDAGVGVWFASAIIASLIGLPLLVAGLARAGRLSWWLLPVSLVGLVAPFFVTGPLGSALGAVGYIPTVVIAVLLLRPTREQ